MAATALQDDDHIVTRNGHVHCLQRDCILPECINLKVGKIKKHIDTSSANRRPRNRGLMSTVKDRVGSTATKEESTEQFWEDIESILKCNVSGNAEIDRSHNRHIIGNLNGMADPREQGSAALSCFDQRGSQPVRTPQPQPWIEGPNLHSLFGQNCKSLKTSCQILTANEPMETEQTSLTQRNSQITNAGVTISSNNIAPACDTPYDATLSDFGTGLTSLKGFPTNFIHSHKGKTQPGLNSRLAWSIVGQTGSDPGVRTRRGKLFGILSQILQAFDGSYTAELEECYASALQKALAEIQAVKGR